MRLQFASVAEMFAEPSRWTQGAEARNASGAEVELYHEDACAWCLSGALARVYGLLESPQYVAMLCRLARALHDEFDWTAPLSEWNDAKDRTHAEVLRVVRVAGI